MKYSELILFYQTKILQFQREEALLKKQLGLVSTARLVVFCALAVFIYFLFSRFSYPLLISSLFSLVGFIVLIYKHQALSFELKFTQQLLLLNQKELRAQTEQKDDFENGAEFVDPQHDFTSDLDIFGPNSIFQHLNRTGTLSGRKALGHHLANPLTRKLEIETYQQAVEDLKAENDFRQSFWTRGTLTEEKPEESQEIITWASTPSEFVRGKLFNILRFVIPAILLGSIVGGVYYDFYLHLYPVFLLSWISYGAYAKKVHEYHLQLSRKEGFLKKYAELIAIFNQTTPQSSHLKQLSERLHLASHQLHQLSNLSGWLDQRLNLLAALFLNTFFFYDFHLIKSLENWKTQNGEHLPQWLESLSEIEVLNSLATFAFNHPDFSYPQIEEGQSIWQAEKLCHPLIPINKRVYNQLEFGGHNTFLVITGSNMSGKSTFLRSVGVNLVLARCGTVVCAEKLVCSPAHIMTSMRIADSLNDHVSYFYAELLRLQKIVQEIEKGRFVFIILDEILKGTNSEDKLEGSLQLIRKFIRFNCMGMVATHDLDLGKLESETQQKVKNFCFESTISQEELSFDYTLHAGIATNKNATFLMNKLKIV